jgi:hypothetical protein
MQQLLDKLKWYKSNLNYDNSSDFTNLFEQIKQKLPDSYKSKLNLLSFFEVIPDEPVNDLPF